MWSLICSGDNDDDRCDCKHLTGANIFQTKNFTKKYLKRRKNAPWSWFYYLCRKRFPYMTVHFVVLCYISVKWSVVSVPSPDSWDYLTRCNYAVSVCLYPWLLELGKVMAINAIKCQQCAHPIRVNVESAFFTTAQVTRRATQDCSLLLWHLFHKMSHSFSSGKVWQILA